jgi:hypothetical protein
MPGRKSPAGQGPAAGRDAGGPPARPAGGHAAEAPVPAAAPGGEAGAGPAAAAGPAERPAGRKSAAVRMMTRPVAVGKPPAARGESQRVADAAKPSQKPQPGRGRRGPRRGASKGR